MCLSIDVFLLWTEDGSVLGERKIDLHDLEELPPKFIKAVDGFVTPKGIQRASSCESPFIYYLKVCVEPMENVDYLVHMFYYCGCSFSFSLSTLRSRSEFS